MSDKMINSLPSLHSCVSGDCPFARPSWQQATANRHIRTKDLRREFRILLPQMDPNDRFGFGFREERKGVCTHVQRRRGGRQRSACTVHPASRAKAGKCVQASE